MLPMLRRGKYCSFPKFMLILLIGLCSIIPVSAQTGEQESQEKESQEEEEGSAAQWSTLETEGRIEWLAENLKDNRFFDRLIETLEGVEEPERGVSLLSRFLPVIEEPDRRYRLLLRLSRLEESVGKLESAQTHYQSAASSRKGEWDFRALFSSAMILIELGDYSLAELQLSQIADKTDSALLRHRASVHLARLKVLEGDEGSARSKLEEIPVDENISPSLLYLMYTLSLHLEMREQAVNIKERLVKEYPRSPEAGMVQGVVDRAPSIEKVFGLLNVSDGGPTNEGIRTPEQPADTSDEGVDTESEEVARAIQTGSFRDAENARYMVEELEKYGFSAEIQEAEVGGTTYHRVVVPVGTDDTAQKIMIRLKERGYEGYQVY